MAILRAPFGVDVTKTVADAVGPQGASLGDTLVDGGNVFMYVHASGAIDQYDLVVIDEAFEAAAGTTTNITLTKPGKGGVAQVAFADNDYGWVLIEGRGTINALTSCAADVKVYTTATAGHVDDATSSVALVHGLRLDTAVGGGGAASVPFTATGPIQFNS